MAGAPPCAYSEIACALKMCVSKNTPPMPYELLPKLEFLQGIPHSLALGSDTIKREPKRGIGGKNFLCFVLIHCEYIYAKVDLTFLIDYSFI